MAENFLDDIAKFGNNALTAMDGMQRQVRKWAIEQVDSAIKNMDLITQEEMDVYTESQNKKIQELENKIATLEKAIKPAAVAKKAAPAKKSTAKKTTTKKKAPLKKTPLKKAS